MAKVFVSYRSGDELPAERLAEELRSRGHTVRFDLWDMKIGDSVVGLLNDGLDSCTHLVLCVSARGWNGQWMNREWMSMLARQLEGAGVKVLPVLLTGGELPAILADIRYADLVRDSATSAHDCGQRTGRCSPPYLSPWPARGCASSGCWSARTRC